MNLSSSSPSFVPSGLEQSGIKCPPGLEQSSNKYPPGLEQSGIKCSPGLELFGYTPFDLQKFSGGNPILVLQWLLTYKEYRRRWPHRLPVLKMLAMGLSLEMLKPRINKERLPIFMILSKSEHNESIVDEKTRVVKSKRKGKGKWTRRKRRKNKSKIYNYLPSTTTSTTSSTTSSTTTSATSSSSIIYNH